MELPAALLGAVLELVVVLAQRDLLSQEEAVEHQGQRVAGLGLHFANEPDSRFAADRARNGRLQLRDLLQHHPLVVALDHRHAILDALENRRDFRESAAVRRRGDVAGEMLLRQLGPEAGSIETRTVDILGQELEQAGERPRDRSGAFLPDLENHGAAVHDVAVVVAHLLQEPVVQRSLEQLVQPGNFHRDDGRQLRVGHAPPGRDGA
mmetsp:Transcript_17438/g.66419  ORF Transcript_17438/g.66419 Transcript_17438/m.66419 type:complete len:208 (+) Transcript_17438:716-1339(+)